MTNLFFTNIVLVAVSIGTNVERSGSRMVQPVPNSEAWLIEPMFKTNIFTNFVFYTMQGTNRLELLTVEYSKELK